MERLADNGQVASKNGFPVDRVANAPKIMPPASVGQRGRWCNGSTAVSKTANEGSIPSLPANIGIELNPKYVEIINKRTSNIQLSLTGMVEGL